MLKARPVYQYYAQQSDNGYRYFYSMDKNVEQGWTLDDNYNDGIAFYAFKHKLPGTVPVYQYYYKQESGVRYFYSTDRNVEACWTLDECYQDGIAFYVCDRSILGTEPIYQYYYQQKKEGGYRHFYSKDSNVNHGWKLDCEYNEGIAFYAF